MPMISQFGIVDDCLHVVAQGSACSPDEEVVEWGKWPSGNDPGTTPQHKAPAPTCAGAFS